MADLEKDKVVYEKHKKLAQTKTSVWSHFLKATDNLSAKCINCNKILKTLGGSTSGLHTHLKAAHSINLKDLADAGILRASTSSAPATSAANVEDETPSKKRKLTDYFHSSNSLPDTISRMAALDGLPFSFFITSKDQRRLMAQSGYKLPTSSNAIKNIVIKHSETVKASVIINKLRKFKAEGVKLSLTLDEWTSLGNRRFMNVNIHSPMLANNFVNLGLVRVIGCMPARTCLQLLETRLSTFELSLKDDIVCSTTDGASVMIAFGREAAIFHQQCLAHGIQLAILDVLYKKKNCPQAQLNEKEQMENDHDFGEFSSESGDEDYDEGFQVTVRSASRTIQESEFIFKELIEKVRKISKLFRKSPSKNDSILQKYVKEELGHELNLILDCKTRWNSLADMLERFVKLRNPIQKALIDLNKDLEISEIEFNRLADLSTVFEILKATVEELCKRDANLMSSDAALMFMLKKLDAMHHEPVARDLVISLKRRIKERRLLVASTLHYLHDPKSYFDSSDDYSDVFLKPNCNEMRKHIEDVQLLSQTICSTIASADEENALGDDETDTLPLKKQLELAVQNKLRAQDTSRTADDIETLIKIEMALYENGGSRGKHLEMAYNNLRSIPPTSVESERAFSSSAYFCNHLRSRLSDKTLDALLFLRSYYQNQRKD